MTKQEIGRTLGTHWVHVISRPPGQRRRRATVSTALCQQPRWLPRPWPTPSNPQPSSPCLYICVCVCVCVCVCARVRVRAYVCECTILMRAGSPLFDAQLVHHFLQAPLVVVVQNSEAIPGRILLRDGIPLYENVNMCVCVCECVCHTQTHTHNTHTHTHTHIMAKHQIGTDDGTSEVPSSEVPSSVPV